MLRSEPNTASSIAYQLGAAALIIALASIVTALGFEHIGGFLPCELCVQQRYAYYFALPVLFIALILVSADHGRWAALLFAAVALGFAINAGLGVYHAGAELGYWPGPSSCGTAQEVPKSAADLLKAIEATQVIPCDKAQGYFLGLSFAGWNALVSLVLFVALSKATQAAGSERDFNP